MTATPSGINTAVAPMPAGAITTLGDLARVAGYVDGGALLAAERHGDVPRLPTVTRMMGQACVDSGLARAWLRDLQQFKLSEPDRLALRNAEAKGRFEASMRERHEREEQERMQREEQRAMFRQLETEHAEEERAEAAKQSARQAIVLDANGRRVD